MAKSKQPTDCHQLGGNSSSDLEEYSSEPKSKVAKTKSKVNWLKFAFGKLFSFFWLFQKKEIPTEIVEEADLSWEDECKILLEILNRSEDSVQIRKPVSILDLPDYLEFVDHPMDLQTVWRQLQDDHYATPKNFAKDVRFIFENANKLKPNISSAMIDRLSSLFEECMQNILFSFKHQKTSAQSKS